MLEEKKRPLVYADDMVLLVEKGNEEEMRSIIGA